MMTDTALPPVIHKMLQADFYPHPVEEPIQLVQTHCSYVLLTGEFVYKVKKPVDFGFLNYSTLAKRKFYCYEELRLNQRGAAELYLEVVAITTSNGDYVLGGEGEAVEYALKMRQFPADGLLSTRFENGTITAGEIEELGRVVANYHRHTETNDYIRSFGTVEKVRESIDQNYEQTEVYIGKAQTLSQFEQTKAYTDNFFATKVELFNQRCANNFIRECHGDLHMGNICCWQGQILLFDCIEFNEPFRFVDVMYDVAFAVMDLQARHRPDLANIFLNTYLEQTGDWEGLQVLPLYLSRQAYVRAKVTSFLLDDSAISPAAKQQAAATAAAYYRQAWEYTQTHQGKIFLMSGVSGSGKSTTAKYISQHSGAILIRSDAVRKHLAGIGLLERGGEEIYTPEMTAKTYGRLSELGILLAQQGWTVILDAKFDRVELRQNVLKPAINAQIPVQIIECVAPESVLRSRLEARTGDIADATADLLTSQLAAAEPFTEEEKNYVKTLDTTSAIAPQLLDWGF
ncbi:hypothetical protein NIES3974_09950 [Calothrix sp. NIES-3974]|nr:hypothetical protein NIES3974_09950 [Calothrix sp. NIES-3974]